MKNLFPIRCLTLALLLIVLGAPSLLASPSTVVIASNVNQPGSNAEGVTVANGLNLTPLAGDTTTNPAPGTIPNGSVINAVQANGTIVFTPPGGAQNSTVVQGGLMISSFMLVSMGSTGLTMETGIATDIAKSQVGLTFTPQRGSTIPADADDFMYALLNFFSGKAYKVGFLLQAFYGGSGGNGVLEKGYWETVTVNTGPTGPTYINSTATTGPDYTPPASTPAGAVGQADANASAEEVVPVVGDLGGPVDINL